jgi:hypothetical protein
MSKLKSPKAAFENETVNVNSVSSENLSEAELSLIDFNLSLNFEELLRNHERALQMMLELRRAGEENDAKNKS